MRNTSGLKRDGNPGHKGAGGRPKEIYKEWVRSVINNPEVRGFIESLCKGDPIEEKILDGPDGNPRKILVSAPAKVRAWAYFQLMEYVESKAPVAVGTGDDGLAQFAKMWEHRYGSIKI